MPKRPIYDLPGGVRAEAIALQIEAAATAPLDIAYRYSPFSQPVTREFVLVGFSEPLDGDGKRHVILRDPAQPEYRFFTLPFGAIGSIDAHPGGVDPVAGEGPVRVLKTSEVETWVEQ